LQNDEVLPSVCNTGEPAKYAGIKPVQNRQQRICFFSKESVLQQNSQELKTAPGNYKQMRKKYLIYP
jgi:hypothetical protein